MENAVISGLPSTGYYIPNFINVEEEEHILNEIHRLPESRWTTLSHRRLLSLPSTLTGVARDTLLAASLPKYLTEPIFSRLKSLSVFSKSPHGAPNHVLVNEYKPGEGIMPHEDGPTYYPITATVSLGSYTVLEIYKKDEHGEREPDPSWRLLQEPRSLLVTTDNMYTDTLHGISELQVDDNLGQDRISNWHLLGDPSLFESGSTKRDTRISLTYRDVKKVANLGGAIKFMSKR